MRWETVPLASVAAVHMGQAPLGESYNDYGEGLGLIAGPGDFSNGGLKVKKFTTSPTKRTRPGDLVVGIRASIGDLVTADGEYCLGRGVAAVRPSEKFDSSYARQVLRWLAPELASRGRGATFLTVTRRDIETLPLPLPPLREQRRIAAILDEADALRSRARSLLSLQAELAEASFRRLEMSLSGVTAPLGEIAEVSSGITKGRRAPTEPLISTPYMTVANVQDRRLDLGTVKTIDVSARERDRYRLVKGDLLLTEGGDPDKLGRGAVWDAELPISIHQNHVFRVRLQSRDHSPDWLNWEVGSAYGKKYFLRAAKQTTGIATINASQLRAFPVRLPTKPAAARFLTDLREVKRLSIEGERRATQLDELFASLQHRAFRGEL